MTECPLTRRDFKCDYPGCRMLSFAEVYPPLDSKDWGWCYLCLLHFIQEYLIKKKPLGWCLAEWMFSIPGVRWLWGFYVTKF